MHVRGLAAIVLNGTSGIRFETWQPKKHQKLTAQTCARPLHQRPLTRTQFTNLVDNQMVSQTDAIRRFPQIECSWKAKIWGCLFADGPSCSTGRWSTVFHLKLEYCFLQRQHGINLPDPLEGGCSCDIFPSPRRNKNIFTGEPPGLLLFLPCKRRRI